MNKKKNKTELKRDSRNQEKSIKADLKFKITEINF